MKKIIFIFPKIGWKFKKTPYPPLGIGYLAAVLIQNGYEVSIVDGQILNIKEYEEKIQNITEEIIGISATIKQIEEVLRISNLIKKKNPDKLVILGGPIVNLFDLNELQMPNIDIIIKGEAENELVQILRKLEEKRIRREKAKIITVKNPINLDELPYPIRELFPLKKYLEIWKNNTGITSTSIITSRGCPFGCIFCDKSISGYKFRARSPQNVVNEMEYLSRKYKINDIFFYDDLFIFDRQRVIEICEEIRKRKLEVFWSAQARADRIDETMLIKMKGAGCTELYFGVESGSDKVLQFLKKGFSRKQILEAFKACHKVGIHPGMYLILGVPGETKEDIEATKTLVKECRPYLLNFSYLMPFPGTVLFQETKQWIKSYCFTEWDEMEQSIYNFPFEISPKEAHDEIYQLFQEMVKKGMECSSLQFCCEQ